jgi:hypothetical protein
VITLPAKTDPGTVQDRLHDLTDGTFVVIAVEILNHPLAERVQNGAPFGGDGGPTTLGYWFLGTETEVYERIAERGFENYIEQYSEGYEEDS